MPRAPVNTTGALSALLRFTDSDYPFGIFKLFLMTIVSNNLNTHCPTREDKYSGLDYYYLVPYRMSSKTYAHHLPVINLSDHNTIGFVFLVSYTINFHEKR